ncbi:hypothetical protein QCA50_008959 [Cerrena zonata]|uniref:Glycopeptide n=1 Tax=Cerrena zonata TaxID=2478898 RepID=A0AAW0G398_9APHY
MSLLRILSFVASASLAVAQITSETHTIVFDNRCGFGTPILKAQNGATLSTGGQFTVLGPLIGITAFLQTGSCGGNGEGCTMVATTLQNPPSPSLVSTTSIWLIQPHAFSVTSGFGYFNGCDGLGADCTNANCPTAFHSPGDTQVEVNCAANNVNLAITFCL